MTAAGESGTRARIGVFGSANFDLVVRVARPPEPGETVFGESFSTIAGGKGLNQAVAAARAGGLVEFIGCVGEDSFGDELLTVLEAEGIGRSAVRRAPGPSGTAHITVDADGQNSIIVVPGANASVVAGGLTPELGARLSWLVTQLELPLPAVRGALAAAKASGARTVLTPAPAQLLPPELLATVDLLVPNQLEAAVLSGEADPVAAAEHLSRLCGDVVVTLGGEGSLWAHQGRVLARVPAERVPVVDTTAAGDTFVGVLVTLLSEGATFPEALRTATRAAAISVGRFGATASMPTRAEITP